MHNPTLEDHLLAHIRHCLRYTFPIALYPVKVMLRLTVSRSVSLDVNSTLERVTSYYFLSESCCVVSVGRPL
jgi:hypothetical protein